MSTINHKVQFLNPNGTGYDTYHAETNVSQVYDFTKAKWLNEIIEDLERRLSNVTGGIDVTELNDNLVLTMQDLDSVESLVTAVQNELAKKYVKPETGITLEDLSANIRDSLSELDKLPAIEEELIKIRTDLKSYIDAEIEKIVLSMKVDVETFISVLNQTSFTLVNKNNVETDVIKVEVGGVEQFHPQNYSKDTDSNGITTIAFAEPLPEGLEVVVSYYGGIDAMNVIIDSLQDEVTIIKDTIGQMPEGLEERINSINGAIDTLTQDISNIDENLNTLTQDISNIEEKVEIDSQRIDVMSKGVNTLTQDMSNAKQRVNVIEGNVASLSQEDSNLSNRITSLNTDVANVGRTTQDNTAKITSLTNTQNAQTTKVADLENRIITLEESGGGSSSDLSQLIREVSYLKLKQEVNERIEGGVLFGDDMNGSIFGLEFDRYNSSNITIGDGKMLIAQDNGGLKLETNISSIYNVGDSFFNKGNGRKIAILDNGHIYCIIKDVSTGFSLMLSEDNGETWNNIKGSTSLPSPFDIKDASIATDGVNIYITALNLGRQRVVGINYKTKEKMWASLYESPLNASEYESCSIAVNRDKKEIHCAYSVKSTRTNTASLNIYYMKATVNSSGDVTWDSLTSLTTNNSASRNSSCPAICVNGYGYPLILYKYSNSTTDYLNSAVYDGSTWYEDRTVHFISNKTQKNPSVTFVPSSVNGLANGRTFVVWSGYLTSSSTKSSINYSYSDDNASTWSMNYETPMVGNFEDSQPSINVDKHGKLTIIAIDYNNNLHRYEKETNGTESYNIIPNVRPSNKLVQMAVENSENSIIPIMAQVELGAIYIRQYLVKDLIHRLNGTAVYKIPKTDYVALFVKKVGQTFLNAYANEILMESELVGDEYQFTIFLDKEQPVTLRLELSRGSIAGGENDAVVKIIGGRA